MLVAKEQEDVLILVLIFVVLPSTQGQELEENVMFKLGQSLQNSSIVMTECSKTNVSRRIVGNSTTCQAPINASMLTTRWSFIDRLID